MICESLYGPTYNYTHATKISIYVHVYACPNCSREQCVVFAERSSAGSAFTVRAWCTDPARQLTHARGGTLVCGAYVASEFGDPASLVPRPFERGRGPSLERPGNEARMQLAHAHIYARAICPHFKWTARARSG